MIFDWAEKIMKKMKWYDMSLVKTISLLVGIIIGAYISAFVLANMMWFIAIIVIGIVVLLYRVFK